MVIQSLSRRRFKRNSVYLSTTQGLGFSLIRRVNLSLPRYLAENNSGSASYSWDDHHLQGSPVEPRKSCTVCHLTCTGAVRFAGFKHVNNEYQRWPEWSRNEIFPSNRIANLRSDVSPPFWRPPQRTKYLQPARRQCAGLPSHPDAEERGTEDTIRYSEKLLATQIQ